MVEDKAMLDELSETGFDSREWCFAQIDRSEYIQCGTAIPGQSCEYLLHECQISGALSQGASLSRFTLDVSP
jgi:hypothetical protein